VRHATIPGGDSHGMAKAGWNESLDKFAGLVGQEPRFTPAPGLTHRSLLCRRYWRCMQQCDGDQEEETTASLPEKTVASPEFAVATLFLKRHKLLVPRAFVRICPIR